MLTTLTFCILASLRRFPLVFAHFLESPSQGCKARGTATGELTLTLSISYTLGGCIRSNSSSSSSERWVRGPLSIGHEDLFPGVRIAAGETVRQAALSISRLYWLETERGLPSRRRGKAECPIHRPTRMAGRPQCIVRRGPSPAIRPSRSPSRRAQRVPPVPITPAPPANRMPIPSAPPVVQRGAARRSVPIFCRCSATPARARSTARRAPRSRTRTMRRPSSPATTRWRPYQRPSQSRAMCRRLPGGLGTSS